MSKTKILLIQVVACMAFGTVLGIAFWQCDGGKPRKRVSEVKVYQGQWIEDTKKIGDWWSVGYLQREAVK